jgi:hypothetical protein
VAIRWRLAISAHITSLVLRPFTLEGMYHFPGLNGKGSVSRVPLTLSAPLVNVPLAGRAIICDMPAPTNERQALERELREELPARLADYQRELASTQPLTRERRERLEWQIRRVEKRMAELEVRLERL